MPASAFAAICNPYNKHGICNPYQKTPSPNNKQQPNIAPCPHAIPRSPTHLLTPSPLTPTPSPPISVPNFSPPTSSNV
eukprot:4399330-Ditylum_brightwellii.AAC.1